MRITEHIILFCAVFNAAFPVCLSGQTPLVVVAHRGSSANYPENTFIAFQKAIEEGACFIELDIRLSADDSVMVIHDETIDRTTNGSGRVNEMTYSELKAVSAGYPDRFGTEFATEKIPALFEVLSFFKGVISFAIELKNVPENRVVELLIKEGVMSDVILMSYNLNKLERVRNISGKVPLLLINNFVTTPDIYIASEAMVNAVATSYLAPSLYIGEAHRKGLQYWVGIVDDPAKADYLYNCGVDAVITRTPGVILEATKRFCSVYPNPFSDCLTIEFYLDLFPDKVFILDIHGNEVAILNPESHFCNWSPADIRSGVYFIYAVSGESTIFEKVLYYP